MIEPKLPEYLESTELLGAGGMGTVYRVFDTRSSSLRAVKSVSVENKQFQIAALENEFEVLKHLSHAQLPQVYEFNAEEGYLLMQYVDGKDLAQYIKSDLEVISFSQRLEILLQLAETLQYVHSAGFVHRDLKPANVILGSQGPVLVDFGICTEENAPTTGKEGAQGTILYRAPEETLCESVDRRADIYSFGVLAFEFLTGESPFGDESDMHEIFVSGRHLVVEPAPLAEVLPDAPAWLCTMIEMCLEKDKQYRFSSFSILIEYFQEHFIERGRKMEFNCEGMFSWLVNIFFNSKKAN